MDFLNFDVLVKIEMVDEFETEFPAITFCNLNPIDFSREDSRKAIDDFLMSELSLHGDYLSVNDSAPLNTALCNREVRDYVRRVPGFYNYSHTIHKMLISCVYDEKECSVNDFSIAYAPIYGVCFTFNGGRTLSNQTVPAKKSRRPGTINGLLLELYTGAPEYQPCWSKNTGLILTINNKSVNPIY